MRKQKLTPEQVKDMEERALSEQAPPSEVTSEPEDRSAPITTMSVMLASGEIFEIGGKTYRLAPFTVDHIDEGYRLINGCPAILNALALATDDGDDKPVNVGLLRERFNQIMRGEKRADGTPFEPISDAAVMDYFSNLPKTLAEPAKEGEKSVSDRMFDVVLFALRRKHPGIQRKDIAGDFGADTYLRAVRAIFRQNTGLVNLF